MKKTFNASLIGCGRMGCFTSEIVKKTAPDIWFPLSHADAIKRHVRLTTVASCIRSNMHNTVIFLNLESFVTKCKNKNEGKMSV